MKNIKKFEENAWKADKDIDVPEIATSIIYDVLCGFINSYSHIELVQKMFDNHCEDLKLEDRENVKEQILEMLDIILEVSEKIREDDEYYNDKKIKRISKKYNI